MSDRSHFTRHGLMLAVSLAALVAAPQAFAQQVSPPTPTAAPSTPSILEEMVATGVITQDQANKILKGAQARDAAKAAVAAPQAQQGMPAGATTSKTADGAVHVQYVPQAVKDEISRDVQDKVMAKAKDEGWAAPNQTPDWVNRIKISGDVRLRSEEDMFPRNNPQGSYDQVNWASLNARSTPFDAANPSNNSGGATSSNALSFNNWDQDRQRERLRARIAVDADIGEGFSTGIRLATGESNSPVTTNQTLGGSGGNFSKYQIWLDRAFLKYEPVNTQAYGVSATVGRFANPFFSTDMIWNNDLNFDGFAASGRYQVERGVTPFVTIGAFPVFDTALDFSTYSETKSSSQDRWLFAGQGGTDWKAAKDTNVKIGAAYYFFNNIDGQQTTCAYDNIMCGSDVFRPTFAQKGNTYMPLRINNYATYPGGTATRYDYQYFGLASGFHELALTGRVDYDGIRPIIPGQAMRVTLDGEFVKNLAFDKGSISTKSMLNGAGLNNRENDAFEGGDSGYMARLTVGTPALARRWDWNVSLAYKYLESDAVVDAFNDSYFGMGGTNLKGFIFGGDLALAKNVSADLRWFSADSIAGDHYSSDVVFLDLNAKF